MTAGGQPYLEALRAVVAWLEACDVPAMIIGGLAVIAHNPRRRPLTGGALA
jgi:hypothetical protein